MNRTGAQTVDTCHSPVVTARPSNSPIVWLALVFVGFCVRILFQGYLVYRSDQLVHVPILWVIEDPTLYPRDVFLQQFGEQELLYFYSQLLRALAVALGLPFGLFALYVICFGLTVWAWFCISKKVFDSYTAGLFFALILVFHRAADVGSNDIIETHIMPRMVAWTACWWALYCTHLRSASLGAIVGGAALAAGVYVHVTVPLQFWPVLSLWLLIRKRREGLIPVALLSAAFLVCIIPALAEMRNLIGNYASSSDPGSLLLCAIVRIPHHMLPTTWGRKIVELAVLVVFWVIVWLPMRRTQREGWQLGLLAAVLAAILTIVGVVSVLWPTERLLLAQPFRLVVPLRAAIYLALAWHVAALARRQTFWSFARAAALIICGLEREIFMCVLVAEIAIVLLERRTMAVPSWIPGAIVLGALLAAGVWESDCRRPALLALLSAAIAYWAVVKPPVRTWLVRWGLPSAVAVGAAFLAALWFLPFERWIGDSDSSWQRRLARFAFEHCPRPFPIAAIEKVGAWAERNTPADALFLIPPVKERAGFHPWSRRSAVFTIKFFSFSRAGVQEWKKRYLAVRGLTAAKPTEIEAALKDIGAKGVEEDYENLTLQQILELVATYEADYVVSEHEPVYESPQLQIVHETRGADDRRSKPLRVYRVLRPADQGQTAAQ